MALGPGPRPAPGLSELERIRSAVSARFPVYETRIGPQSLLLAVRIDPTTLEGQFDHLRRELRDQGYIPLLRREFGEEFIEVVRRPRVSTRGLWVNLVLLGATLATTVFAGALIWLTYVGGSSLTLSDVTNGAVYFAVPIMAILGLHELAHYAIARRRNLDASLPFFVPVPPPLPFGTFGAFVSIRDPFPDRKAMFDVSAGGPLAGFAASIPIALGGLYLSEHAPVLPASYCAPTILGLNYGHEIFSPSLLWSFFSAFFPSSTAGVHPLAIAGWVGILVTSINLLPIGALDGGRVFRAVFGDRTRYVSYAAAFALFGLSIFYFGWFIFGVLVLFLGLRNPPPLNDLSPLGNRRYAVGAVVAAVLVAGFVVVPIQLPAGSIGLAPQAIQYSSSAGPGVAANLSVLVENHDPVDHGFRFEVTVLSVTSGGAVLDPAELAAWAASANWTFVLPSGATVASPPGASAELPSSEYVALDGRASAAITVRFSDPHAATNVLIGFAAIELCPPTNGGYDATNLYLTFS